MNIDKNKRIGLTDEQVRQSREQHGKNVLTPPQRTSLWKLYLDKYRDPIIQILLVAAFVSLILAFIEKNFMETIGIFVAVFLATTVGFYFERDAAKKFNLLTALSEEQPVKVRRNGKVMEIPRHDVVVGDVVLVEVGDEVPADGELIVCNDLQINESALTGEPVAEKSLEGGGDGAYPRNVILRSTMVMNGRGEFVVTAVGDATEIGKVAKKSTEQTSVETPLHMQLDKLAKRISKVGSVVSVTAFFIFLIHDILTNPAWGGKDYFYMAEIVLKYFMMAVTLIVMAVPEGLPMAITLSLALNMRRMLKSNNLVRKLHACETMGAVTVICTDKTGTLTQNKMQVSALELKQGDETLLDTAIALNSTAELNDGKPIGNPTESALLLWLDAQGKDYEELRKQVNVLKQLPFSTERKMMATLAEVDGETYLFVKGAPEIVMKKCIIEDRMQRQSAEELDEWQHKAMRTLAFAYKKIEASIMRTSRTSTAEVVALLDANDLQLQAIAAIADPIRPDVPAAVQECRHAGIEVKVVTGDTAATALEIGKQIGVFEDEPENIGADGSLTSLDQQMITGEQWEALSDEEAYERAKDIRVMSRARPTDKQRLVAMLQKRGEVVAVTGDGTNDAPALHYAHVGLSLGSGTSVAKEASDMTLLDDSFKSIANAVMWGRSLYRNLQRFLFFQLVVNVAALLLVLGGSVIGTEMPLTVTQILWVNLIMDTFAALALASLPPSHEVMKDKPRKASDFIINKSIGFGILFCGIVFFLVMFALLVYCERRGKGGVDVHELTMFFTTFVMIQFWNLFNAKALMSHHTAFRHFLKDKGMILVLVLVLVGQWIIVTFGGEMFRTTPLSLHEWLLIIGSTSVVLWAGELWRTFKRMIAKRR
ncbi:calcium-translocating P-type ATPase, PMCA-type [Segatella copri]|uniref:P-type Ca(2+) transporter n=1 Tax=Segatella copri DSM 18205 TaxID=537011 RepID=D1PH21_9BACT|nr:calcium-translocating P-type ATPase, PMCA-type [Segatella copri]EFB33975.1 calcium-translocating P-type ATPase, PMCA-type [Segatella copri DSM 18205]MCW4097191.1 calcium-translocating P-type ATPase, PMCA-type [Segatella copri]MQP19502.1 calcium-translocating P-type ATPase, PMCA-type [Segatella copri DSM 18205]UEA43314.1 calcium-translocating P-type ATPase, PMCA-type [Segatella copri DSM 18205]UWP52076.1 calcium-translocating P-type ATPase, PMCA-type [Segatella copri DSM 18205]